MATVDAKKNRKKSKRNNGVMPNAPDKPNGTEAASGKDTEPKQYSLTQQERAAWEMVLLRLDFAREKQMNARHLQENAEVLKQQWVMGVFQRRAIDPSSTASVDTEKGVLTVRPNPKVPPLPAPPTPDETPTEQEAGA